MDRQEQLAVFDPRFIFIRGLTLIVVAVQFHLRDRAAVKLTVGARPSKLWQQRIQIDRIGLRTAVIDGQCTFRIGRCNGLFDGYIRTALIPKRHIRGPLAVSERKVAIPQCDRKTCCPIIPCVGRIKFKVAYRKIVFRQIYGDSVLVTS